MGELRGKELPESYAWSYKRTPSDESRKTSSEIEEESPVFGSETSTLTDDSPAPEPAKLEEEEEMHGGRRSDAAGEKSSSLRSLFAKKKRGGEDGGDEEKNGGTPRSTTSDSTTFGKSRSSSGAGGSSIFRNLISCGTVDTNDSAVLPMQRRRPVSGSPLLDKDVRTSAEICKPEKVGGSQRIYRTNWNQEQQSKPRKSCSDGVYNGGRRSFSGTYKSPNCSQCGKPFNPEKLHAHMMSCKGMKMWAKSTHPVSSAAEKDSEKSTKNSVSAR
nr:protein UPSTREAM OF FLC [Ipomoea batatas]